MTALDDALGEASIVLGPHQVLANWRETDNGDLATNGDSVSNLSSQFGGTMTVSHSLNDALPDSVTMSSGVDASGILDASLVGREGLTLASSGQRSYDASSTTTGAATTSLTTSFVNTVQRGDFVICAVLINDATATLVQNAIDPKDQWTFQGVISDSPYSLYVYTMRGYYPGRAALSLTSDKSVSYIAITTAFWAINPVSYPLSYRVTNVVVAAEASSVTSHAVTSTLTGKGYQIGIWADASSLGAWTAGAGVTVWGSSTASSMIMMTGTTALRDSGVNTINATQGSATAVAVMAAISIEPYARPRMDARKYFSPFNRDSPVYGFDRDTATVLTNIRILTSAGPVDTQVFYGQMQGIPVSGRSAGLSAVSKTRIRLNRSVSLPVVNGYREGLTLDWLVTWLLARGSQFIGPSPNRYTRYWAPLHGSVHAHLDSPYGYNSVQNYLPPTPPGGPYGTRNPTYVDGPFLLGMFGQQTATRTDRVILNPGTNNLPLLPTQEFPHIVEAGGAFVYDAMSVSNSKGRLSIWIRGDAALSAPSYLTAPDDFLFYASLLCSNNSSGIVGWVKIGIDSANRRANITMGSDAFAYTIVSYAVSGLLPTDGAWHFFGFWWDFAAGTAKVKGPTTEGSSSAWATNGNNSTAGLPLTDDQAVKLGYSTQLYIASQLPLSEVMFDTGIPYAAGLWDDQLTVIAPAQSATMRPLRRSLVGIAESTALNCWDTIADLAKASISAYRVNELDNIEFLPPSYFGETAQMTASAVQDTKKNAGDLDVTIDASKVRNNVTVQFNDSRIDAKPQPMLQYLTSVQLSTGTTVVVFPMDIPCVEVHGSAATGGTDYSILNLTSSQISTPTLPTANHFMTINTATDGTGTVLSAVQVKATIIATDALSITLKFVNMSGSLAYLVNNGNQVPFLQILGYGLRQSDGYTTVSDSSSKLVRGDRSLDTDLYWVQDRSAATDISAQLLGILARPRPELGLKVVGDPRRKPGQLITILDSEGTGAAGTWRILSVTHNVSGAEYTQDLDVVQVLPPAVWDGLDGWDNAVWS
jgi:hypothetical protein